MRRLILGTAGHIDHGKTALVHALTGVDTDRLPEEKRRGITIDLGFASLTLPSGAEVGIVDVPGHDAFVRNMLAGATGVDLALLVVAADEGVMPQTREHLAILELLGVPAAVIALTKCDLVEDDWLELVQDEMAEVLNEGPFAGSPILAVSARAGTGLEALLDTIDARAADIRLRRVDDVFRMPVDRVFTIQGTGTVVTGTVWSGTVARDDSVTVLPGGRTARLRGVQSHGQERDQVGPGERAALALASTAREEVARGQTIVKDEGWCAATMLTVRLRVLPSAPPLRSRQRVRFHLGTAEALGRVVVLDGTMIEPGREGWAQLRLETPVVARARDRFVIRSYSPVTTIGGGIVAEPNAPKRRRLTEDDVMLLAALLAASTPEALHRLLLATGWTGTETTSLPIRLGAPPAHVNEAVAASCVSETAFLIGDRIFHASTVEAATRLVLDAVDRIHREFPLRPGADRDELRRALPPHAPHELAEYVLAHLVQSGTLAPVRAALRRARHVPKLTPDQENTIAALERHLADAGLAAPTTAELAAGVGGRADAADLLRLLEDEGAVVALRHDVYVGAAALREAVARLRAGPSGTNGLLTPADFRELFGISRKYLIPLLEYLDRAGVTVRHGDARSVNPL